MTNELRTTDLEVRVWHKEKKCWFPSNLLNFTLSLTGNFMIDNVIVNEGVVDVCRYTGLRDSNGKKIYEGDIIDTKQQGIELVEMIEEYDFIGYRACWEKGVILGNTYEHPQLLSS